MTSMGGAGSCNSGGGGATTMATAVFNTYPFIPFKLGKKCMNYSDK